MDTFKEVVELLEEEAVKITKGLSNLLDSGNIKDYNTMLSSLRCTMNLISDFKRN
jgi:hypothetical protein